MSNVLPNLARQKRKPDAAILVRHQTEQPAEEWCEAVRNCGIPEAIVLQARSEYTLSQVLDMGYAKAAEMIESGLICSFDDDDLFCELYFTELEECFLSHPDAAIIGKALYPVHWVDGHRPDSHVQSAGEFPCRVNSVAGPTIAVNAEFYRAHPEFRHDPVAIWADASIIEACHKVGGAIYSTGPDNFVLQRYPAEHGHGWQMPEE
jgi:hypothetical protein